jgi:hypothetical protein
MKSSRILEGECTEIGCRGDHEFWKPRAWPADLLSRGCGVGSGCCHEWKREVFVRRGGELVAMFSFAAADTMTVRVLVLVRPALSETTYSIV